MYLMKFPFFFGKSKPAEPRPHFDPPRTDTPFCVIGDVHGRLDLLQDLLAQLPFDKTIICVGDLVDRGEHSADVLRFVQEHDQISSLMGNHEAMLLNFLRNPETHGRRWMRNGGLQTLASFGVSGITQTSGADTLTRARDALYNAMGDDLIRWVSGLDSIAWSGNVAIVHAGANPAQPLDEHDPDTFIWGHPDFSKMPRRDGFWIVHGHTIVDDYTVKGGRISIDTGAYATGRLTAAVFSADGVTFVTT
jgi:serine/threonine protein phosphatase 1